MPLQSDTPDWIANLWGETYPQIKNYPVGPRTTSGPSVMGWQRAAFGEEAPGNWDTTVTPTPPTPPIRPALPVRPRPMPVRRQSITPSPRVNVQPNPWQTTTTPASGDLPFNTPTSNLPMGINPNKGDLPVSQPSTSPVPPPSDIITALPLPSTTQQAESVPDILNRVRGRNVENLFNPNLRPRTFGDFTSGRSNYLSPQHWLQYLLGTHVMPRGARGPGSQRNQPNKLSDQELQRIIDGAFGPNNTLGR